MFEKNKRVEIKNSDAKRRLKTVEERLGFKDASTMVEYLLFIGEMLADVKEGRRSVSGLLYTIDLNLTIPRLKEHILTESPDNTKYTVCIDDKGNETTLKIGNKYQYFDYDDEMVLILDETGAKNWYCIEGFDLLHELKGKEQKPMKGDF